MSDLKSTDFTEFFGAVYQSKTGTPLAPMDWQLQLATAACAGTWPQEIAVPTGAGKTAAIDVAVFALAFQADKPPQERTAPMRTFLVVDRRTVVSEAFYRAKRLSEMLAAASNGILKDVADRLRSYSDSSSEPLKVVELRGGIFRDPAWCDSLVQPMIITSTVDQVGSRLLFRGYGVSESSRPIQAAAVAHDSLIILDEAHISPAFSRTLSYVQGYQAKGWSEHRLPLPLGVVKMTATPSENSEVSRLEIATAELADPTTHIGNIVNRSKPAKLLIADKVKGAKAPAQLAAVMVEKIIQVAGLGTASKGAELEEETQKTPLPQVIGILCNMVATAKEVREQLLKHKQINASQIHLIIGSMRPRDRDDQTRFLRETISTGTVRDPLNKPLFVVATQCIEVGADYDFDTLITEAAPLDSLIQRFGRLNRAGRDIPGPAWIVIRGDRIKQDDQLAADDDAFKMIDPIYGNAMSYTWNWLTRIAQDETVDFGIASLKRTMASLSSEIQGKLTTEKSDAPVLLPAHLDLLCQTTQSPWPDPDVSLWLHGPQRNDPDVQVCWRSDLVSIHEAPNNAEAINFVLPAQRFAASIQEKWGHAISLCPPTSSECLSVSMRRLITWLSAIAKQKRPEADTSSDLNSIAEVPDNESLSIPWPFRPMAWRGVEKSVLIENTREIRPGDTLVFPVIAGGWSELGFIPEFDSWTPRTDQGSSLFTTLQEADERGDSLVACLREDWERLKQLDCAEEAFKSVRNRAIVRLHPSVCSAAANTVLNPFYKELRNSDKFQLTRGDCLDLLASLPENMACQWAGFKPKQISIEYYADRSGIVVKGPHLAISKTIPLPDDDGSDLYSQIDASKPIELQGHLSRVQHQAAIMLDKLPLEMFKQTILYAAAVHDWGKADPRFQAMLHGGDLYAAAWHDRLFAKSAKMASNLQERQYVRDISSLPTAFRHELISVALAELAGLSHIKPDQQALLLHLIASHHGFARPWVPVCDDPEAPPISLERIDRPEIVLDQSTRQTQIWHRLDSPIIDRFWQVTRRYGWWGAAYLESILRLADRRASQIESQEFATASGSNKTPVSPAITIGSDA